MAWKTDFTQAPFHSSAVYGSDQGPRFYVREVLGIAEAVCAILIFLSIYSARRGDQWIGAFGDWAAVNLTFAVGNAIVFALPAMLGINAIFAMVGRRGKWSELRAVARGIGGILLIAAGCGLMTLQAKMRGVEDPAEIFNAGGVIGNFLMDTEGLNVARYLGRTGAMILLGGCALIGLVLFTEIMIREVGLLLVRAFAFVFIPARLLDWMGDRFYQFRQSLSQSWIALFGRVLHGLNFRRRAPGRVLAPSPIIELRPAGLSESMDSDAFEDRDYDDSYSGYDNQEDPFEGGETGDSDGERWTPPEIDAGYRRGDDDRIEDDVRYDDEAREPEMAGDRRYSDEAERREAEPCDDGHVIDGDDLRGGLLPEVPADGASVCGRYEEIADTPPGSSSRIFRLRRQKSAAPPPKPDQPQFEFPKVFELPSMEILKDPPPATYRMSEEEAAELSRKIEQTLAQFKIEVEVIEVIQGPTVTRFALRIAPGIRVSKILALENDLALALRAQQVRILAPIPGQAAVGIEVPNKQTNGVYLRELLETETFRKSKSPLSFALGKNISGEPVIADLAQMPHLLIAGATGSGKSVCLNTIIASLLFRNTPDKVKMVMIDPKRVELAIYQAIPHLIAPVVCEPRKAAAALTWAVEQMESRYKLLAEIGVRNIDGYNTIVNDKQPNKKAMGRDLKYMPHIVVVIDELADLMMVAKNEVEEYVIRLAQLARAVGIHLIVATQRPSVNVITGIIKANFPSRIAFRVSSKVDSRTILDMNGAQALLGRGDMLYSPGGVKPFRIQGAYVSDEEIERLADYIRSQEKARYEKEDFEPAQTAAQKAKAHLMMSLGGPAPMMADSSPEDESENLDPDGDAPPLPPMPAAGRVNSIPLPPVDLESLTDDDLYDVALKLVLESRKASVSYIQRRLKIGYARAGRVMDMMEENGIVGPYQGSKPRDLIVDPVEYSRRLAEIER